MTIEELKKKSQWINWNKKIDGDRISKIPCAYDGSTTGTNNKYADTWKSFDIVNNDKHDGIGLIFTNGICGIDIDNRDIQDDLTQNIITLMNTYTEISPSGNGIHMLFTCDITKLPHYINKDGIKKLDNNYYQKNSKEHIECYIDGLTNRFFTFTENRINNEDINERTDELLIFLNQYMKKENVINSNNNKNIIDRIINSRQGEKFKKLFYDGDITDYHSDDSAADMGLCNILAFYTNGDYDLINDFFCKSKLNREKWKREDYKRNTIEKAIKNCNGKFYNGTKQKKYIEFDLNVLKDYLNTHKIKIKYNEIKKQVEVYGCYKNIKNNDLKSILPSIINSDLKKEYKYCDFTTIQKYLDVIAMENIYNPVVNILDNSIWNKKDYFHELTIILGIENDKISSNLLYKWLHQCISLLNNNIDNPFGADGMLVIQGPQGIGKTSFVKKIAFDGKFCGLGKSFNQFDKDTKRWCCSDWIVELGEIEQSLKSNIEQLKAFITDGIDLYRLPYGATDILKARKTSLIGTCNSIDYLIDTTGNRRFWTIPIKKIDLEKLSEFNVEQLWSQIKYETKNNLQGFRLTSTELEQLNQRNLQYEKKLPAEEEITDILSLKDDEVFYKDITITEFKNEFKTTLSQFSVQQISKVLSKKNIQQKHCNNKRLRYLPTRKINCSIR